MMRATIVGALLLAGCAGEPFDGGDCLGRGTGACASGRVALCRVPACDGEGWIDYDTTGVLCARTDDGSGQPYCERDSDEMCWTEEEVRELCAVD